MDQRRLFLPAIDSALPAPARDWLRSVRRGVLRDLDDSDVDGPGVSWVVAGVALAHPTPVAVAELVPLSDDDLAAKVATARAALELLTSR